MPNPFFDALCKTTEERQVEDIYNDALKKAFFKSRNNIIRNDYNCDGLIISDSLKLLIEYKFDVNLKNEIERAKVIIQVIFYLKQFENNGDKIPNVIFIADKNEAFVLQSNSLIKYLDKNIDWNISPSSAHSHFPSIVREIAIDDEINPFVFDVDNSFNFKKVVDKINNLSSDVKRLTKLSEHNLSRSYNYFCTNIIKDSSKIPTNDLVGVFIRRITDNENCYKHPIKNNILVCNGNEYRINGKAFDAFFSNFEGNYTVKEQKFFTEIADRLIEDTKRRKTGEFYTPTIFADLAHKILSEQLDDDWRNQYVVWDCCWGTGNLTRDYKFNELYCSTNEQGELDCGKRYNSEATKFIFDFLNDGIISPSLYGNKIPEGLNIAIKRKKPIVFLINPPYATASSDFSSGKGKGSCSSRITDLMVKDGMSNSSKNLFAQFLYNIIRIKKHFQLTNINIGLFCNPIFLSGSAFNHFRNIFLKEFCYKYGVLFNASHFSDVSNTWGINFSVWSSGETKNKREFIHHIISIENDEIIQNGEKIIYNNDGIETAKEWIKEPIKNIKQEKIQKPTLSSGIQIKKNTTSHTTIFITALGCYFNIGNDVYNSSQKIAIFTSCDNSNSNGISIMPKNFERICAIFAARRLVSPTWINHFDNFLIPKNTSEYYDEFINDSIVFSLFNSKSQQSSLRKVKFQNKFWDINNEFFYISKNDILNLANKYGFNYTYNDANLSKDRYVYNKLNNIKLSKEAHEILSYARTLTLDSFKFRDKFNNNNPEYQIMNWDCGWYQIKHLLKKYMSDELIKFSKIYNRLCDKMRPLIYEIGFLK